MMYADEVATLIYRKVEAEIRWDTMPDGIEMFTLPNGYTVGINDDDHSLPPGISWWAYDPDGQPVESDGWTDDCETVEDEVDRLARYIEALAAK